jgi:hypothetical protein
MSAGISGWVDAGEKTESKSKSALGHAITRPDFNLALPSAPSRGAFFVDDRRLAAFRKAVHPCT